MWILGHDFSGHYNRLALISVDIINGVYCTWGSLIFVIVSGYRRRIPSYMKLKILYYPWGYCVLSTSVLVNFFIVCLHMT